MHESKEVSHTSYLLRKSRGQNSQVTFPSRTATHYSLGNEKAQTPIPLSLPTSGEQRLPYSLPINTTMKYIPSQSLSQDSTFAFGMHLKRCNENRPPFNLKTSSKCRHWFYSIIHTKYKAIIAKFYLTKHSSATKCDTTVGLPSCYCCRCMSRILPKPAEVALLVSQNMLFTTNLHHNNFESWMMSSYYSHSKFWYCMLSLFIQGFQLGLKTKQTSNHGENASISFSPQVVDIFKQYPATFLMDPKPSSPRIYSTALGSYWERKDEHILIFRGKVSAAPPAVGQYAKTLSSNFSVSPWVLQEVSSLQLSARAEVWVIRTNSTLALNWRINLSWLYFHISQLHFYISR